MAKAGSLKVFLTANSDRLTAEIKKARKSVAGFSSFTKRAFKGIVSSIFSLKSAFLGLAGIGGIGYLIKQSLEATDRIGKMSKTYGIATKDLAAFELATRIGGSSLEQFAKAARQMSKNTFDFVVRGTGEATDAFQALGITQSDLKPIMNDQVSLFGLIGDKLNKMPDGAEKTALAYKLLGGRSLELLPALEGGSKAFEDYRKEAILLGTALSQDTVKGVERANDAVTRMGLLFRGLRDQTVAALAPALEHLASITQKWLLNIAESEGGVVGLGKKIATSIISLTESSLRAIQKYVEGFNKIWMTLFGGAEKKGEDLIGINFKILFAELEILKESIVGLPELELIPQDKVQEHLTMWQKFGNSLKDIWASIAGGIENKSKALTGFILKDIQTMAGSAAANSKKMFQLNKVAAISDGVLALRSSISGAYAVGAKIGGPVLGAAYAAISGAAQLANLSAIKSSSFGGGGGAGSVSGGALPIQEPITALPTPEEKRGGTTQITVIGRPGIQYDNDTMDELIDNIRDAVERGDKILIDKQSRNGLELAS